jgi:hypothetical protein
MKRTVFVLVSAILLAAPAAWATSRTLSAVANVQGQALFQSDVRVFNPSYTATITVTAKYHYCQGGTCNHEKDESITISPRQAAAFNDIAVSLFALPNTQGAIEFETDAADLVVTSRLYSNSLLCQGSVGQFVPGLEDSDAFATSVLTSLQQNADFRTNIVMFNPSSSVSLPVMVQVFSGDSGSQIGSNFTTTLGPEVFFPSSNLFTLVGATSGTSSNAYAKVTTDGTHPVFAAASVLDNHSQDTIFVKGELDTTAPPQGTTVTIIVSQFNFDPGGPVSAPVVLTVGVDYTLVFHSIDVQHGFSGVSDLNLPSTDNISPGQDFVITHFRPQAYQRGLYGFHCIHVCGDFDSHLTMIGTLLIQ